MTISEELALIESAKTGDKESMEKLIKWYRPFMNDYLSRYHGEWRKDLEQEIMVGFIEAVYKHDSSRAQRLRKIADYYIRLHISNFHRNIPIVPRSYYSTRKENLTLEDNVVTEEFYEHQLTTEPDAFDAVYLQEIHKKVREVILQFSRRERLIIYYSFLTDEPSDSLAAKALNVSRQRIQQLKPKIKEILRIKLTPVRNNLTIYA